MSKRRNKILLCFILAIAIAVSFNLFWGWESLRDIWKKEESRLISDGGMSMASFSYEQDVARYQNADVNIILDGFMNTKSQPISDQIEAEERAKTEVTVAYNATSHYRDIQAGIWCIDFYTLDRTEKGIPVVSNSQKVYLNDDGVTQMVVYEE